MALGVLAGCVNNYVLVESQDESGGGTTTADPTSDDTCADGDTCKTTTMGDASASGTTSPTSSSTSASSSSSSSSSSDGSDPDASGGDPSDGGSVTMGDPTAGICDVCTTDASCGDEGGFCVELDMPRCLGACTEMEPPCPDGFVCEELTTVDGAMGSLCAPMGADCPQGS